MMIAAYTRISTNKETQKHDRQEKALADYARKHGFEISMWCKDTITGKTSAESRPNYQYLKSMLSENDILLLSDLDRLGRDATDTILEIKDLQQRGIRIVSLDIPYMSDWNSMRDDSMSRMIIDIVVTIKAHIAQQEREKTVSRINQGLAVCRANGIKLGRPIKQDLPADFIKKYEAFLSGAYGKLSIVGFAKMLGLSRSTVYKYINIYNSSKKYNENRGAAL
ncbi:recombinase family protein [Clostridium sp. OS1-26]|uniref:recombinase family protein n=1 Tax=Clostridium sp. OS1-26 TaxID=3070681 RepID=UPI0027DF6EB2|nr:recombinase family protein [Clostridium sp. OS1-26]WML36943.1 recombinase family protein [Clostridium sp. OS1-26]